MIEVKEYDLADAALIQYAMERSPALAKDAAMEYRMMVFLPSIRAVVLGQSNTVERSVNLAECARDGISILKRPSGGEAVLISPNTVIISFCMIGSRLKRSSEVFRFALENTILALNHLGIEGVEHKGISDLTLKGKKILGCAIYRRTGMILYHAVLNICETPALIAKYLSQPSRQPDYRANRSHEEFVTSLYHEGYQPSVDLLIHELKDVFITASDELWTN